MATYSELRGRVVLLTGGANGIGAATVRAFHAQGARVFFCDVDVPTGRALARELGRPEAFARVDLTKPNQIVRWITQVAKRVKTIHVLVNNAARDPRIPLDKTSVQQWDDLFACNLRPLFVASREAAKWMRDHAGVIINFSSITIHTAPANMTAYVATKGAILTFTRSLARELGRRGLRANVISPGWVMTERQLLEFITPAVKKLIHNVQCVPDRIQPEEIAEVVLFLASDSSRAITGQEILADRGWAHS